ncbi:MAG: hypothetical protein IT332_00635 [Ardenticatenales bacterium]|nr:hypothetical protein [Ardenticatenales bacterium]
MNELAADPLGYLRLAAAVGACLTLPGSAVLTLLRHPSRGIGRLALSIGVSLATIPVAVLWASTAGIRWSWAGLAAVLGLCAAVTVVWGARLFQRRRTGAGHERTAAGIGLLLVLATAVALRASQAVDLVAAPWVDGYHHTLMAQLFIDRGAVPTSYRPYLAVDGYYYHFGFHSVAAVVAVLANVPARLAVLWLGQTINASASLTTWLLARRLGVSPTASIWAAAVPTGLYFFPAYFLSWGRETQLTGLVVLPAALMLLIDAIRPEPADLTLAESIMRSVDRPNQRTPLRRVVAAALAAAGLLLVHYRVMIFYALGAVVLVGWLALRPREAAMRAAVRTAFVRLAATAMLAIALVMPWFWRHLLPGIRHLQQASADWYVGPTGVDDIQMWHLTERQNALWLAVGMAGLVWALLRRNAAATSVGAWLCLAALAVALPYFGLPRSWMLPPSALTISLFMPVAIGVALFAEGAGRLAAARTRRPGVVPWVVAAAAVLATWQGAAQQSDVVRADTVLLRRADLDAMAWVRANTPAAARFVIGTKHWQYGTYRGVDGGYWLPLLTGRQTTVPAALYTYGDPEVVRQVGALCRTVADIEALSAAQLSDVFTASGADYAYVGAGASLEDGFSAARLREQPDLRQVYAQGGVAIFEREPPTAASGREPPAEHAMTHFGGVKRHSHQYSLRDDVGTGRSRRLNERSARTGY